MPASRAHWFLAGGAMLVFLALSIGHSLTRCPWWDEGCYFDIALSFRNFGHLGSSVLDPHGWLDFPGVHQYTYTQLPLYFIMLGTWLRLVPTTVVWMRFFSVMWGCVFVASWFVVVRSLSRNEPLALLVASVVALDYVSLIKASEGRMDMMCAALGVAGLASYFRFRDSNWTLGVLLAACFGAASLFCHPMGAIMNVAIAAMVLLDWRRIKVGALLAASLPYVIGAAGCLYYIYRAPEVFLAQSKAVSEYRTTGLGALLPNLWSDASKRYIRYYYEGYAGIAKLKIVSLIFPVAGVVGLLADRNLRSHAVAKRLLLLACIGYVGVAVLDNLKVNHYLIFSVPAMAACGAVWVHGQWQKGGRGRFLACFLLAAYIAANIGGIGYKIYRNDYRNLYDPAIAAIRRSLPPGGLVMGGSELGFGLGFGPPLVDDRYLGFFSGQVPDVVAIDEYYGPLRRLPVLIRAWNSSRSTLRGRYHLIFVNKAYSIYVRNEAPVNVSVR